MRILRVAILVLVVVLALSASLSALDVALSLIQADAELAQFAGVVVLIGVLGLWIGWAVNLALGRLYRRELRRGSEVI